MSATKHFTGAAGRVLSPRDAAAALLVLPGDRYVMQRRDDRPDIFYPGHWCCFGGAMNTGEAPVDTLRRELREELELELPGATQFGKFEFDLAPQSTVRFFRIFFEVRLTEQTFSRLRLHEGAEMKAFDAEDLLRNYRIAPYDAFAVWLHAARRRIVPPPPGSSG